MRTAKALVGGLATMFAALSAVPANQSALHVLATAVLGYIFGHGLVWLTPNTDPAPTNQG